MYTEEHKQLHYHIRVILKLENRFYEPLSVQIYQGKNILSVSGVREQIKKMRPRFLSVIRKQAEKVCSGKENYAAKNSYQGEKYL
mgnify:FL=1